MGHKGWTLRLDTYLAIGLPEGSICYTTNGQEVPMKGIFLSAMPIPTAMAVGKVTGPYVITNDFGEMIQRANAYYTLNQKDTGLGE